MARAEPAPLPPTPAELLGAAVAALKAWIDALPKGRPMEYRDVRILRACESLLTEVDDRLALFPGRHEVGAR